VRLGVAVRLRIGEMRSGERRRPCALLLRQRDELPVRELGDVDLAAALAPQLREYSRRARPARAPAKVTLEVKAGDVVTIETPGGGGYGR
jgi:N-methylhydantoinase B/oxoprolinase/acetone carboxylase alpha subunit